MSPRPSRSLGYIYREGDVISYAVPPRPDIARFSIEREDEDEFGQPLRTAYKLLGRTNAVSFSVAYQLTRYASVQVGYEYAVTTARSVAIREPRGGSEHRRGVLR
jgi:hypothetical protein